MILVTGATGFIGSHLVPRLVGFTRVRCVVRPGSEKKIAAHPSVETISMDLSSAENFDLLMEGVDCVIHLAALLRKESAEKIHAVNAAATQKLVDACKKRGVRRFIFVSTENALREDLHDAYAESKREAESIVSQLPQALILRPCFVYGAGDTHGLGRLVGMARKKFLVPLFGGLKSQVQPIYIDDMVEYLVRAAQTDIRGEFVIAGPETIGLNEFIRRALEILGEKRVLMPVPYACYYLAAVLGDALLPSAGWGRTQLRNIYHSRTYSNEETVRAFGVTPRNLDAGLKAWLGADARG